MKGNDAKSARMRGLGEFFSAPPPADLGDLAPATRRVSSGSVHAMRDFTWVVERENDELRAQLAKGAAVLELDPGLVDASPVQDRIEEPGDPSFLLLKASIAERGQEVPVLVRAHPSQPGRFQSAYGHRRVRACRDLGVSVKALVRDMGDDQLVVAQGLENAAREDLTFIEKAGFALRLERAGHARAVIQAALAVDKAEVSKMISSGSSIPAALVLRIGRAPKVGRQRWVALGEALRDRDALDRANEAAEASGFAQLPSDERFARVLAAANATSVSVALGRDRAVTGTDGVVLAAVARRGRVTRLTLDGRDTGEFGRFLLDELPALYNRFRRGERGAG